MLRATASRVGRPCMIEGRGPSRQRESVEVRGSRVGIGIGRRKRALQFDR
jgi:hypothetical protein